MSDAMLSKLARFLRRPPKRPRLVLGARFLSEASAVVVLVEDVDNVGLISAWVVVVVVGDLKQAAHGQSDAELPCAVPGFGVAKMSSRGQRLRRDISTVGRGP